MVFCRPQRIDSNCYSGYWVDTEAIFAYGTHLWVLVHCGSFSSPNTMIHLGGIWGCQVRAAMYGFPIAAPSPFHSGVIHLA